MRLRTERVNGFCGAVRLRQGKGRNLVRRGRRTDLDGPDQILITEQAYEKAAKAFVGISEHDDEHVHVGLVIADSDPAVFVDVATVPDTGQVRGRHTVVLRAEAVNSVVERALEAWGGKVRPSPVHIHQFSLPMLSSVDIGTFRRTLASDEIQPYRDRRMMPVLLVNGAGRGQTLMGFRVTAFDCHEVPVRIVADSSPVVTRALDRAPVAAPELGLSVSLLRRIENEVGSGWSVDMVKKRSGGDIGILLRHRHGDEYLVDLGADWQRGVPKIRKRGCGDITSTISWPEVIDWRRLGDALSAQAVQARSRARESAEHEPGQASIDHGEGCAGGEPTTGSTQERRP